MRLLHLSKLSDLSIIVHEFDCTLREIVGDCIGEYLWMKTDSSMRKIKRN